MKYVAKSLVVESRSPYSLHIQECKHSHLSLAMSDASRAIFEDANGRKLDPILAGTHTALVKDVLIVGLQPGI